MQAKFTPTLFEKDLFPMSQVDPYAELRAGVLAQGGTPVLASEQTDNT